MTDEELNAVYLDGMGPGSDHFEGLRAVHTADLILAGWLVLDPNRLALRVVMADEPFPDGCAKVNSLYLRPSEGRWLTPHSLLRAQEERDRPEFTSEDIALLERTANAFEEQMRNPPAAVTDRRGWDATIAAYRSLASRLRALLAWLGQEGTK